MKWAPFSLPCPRCKRQTPPEVNCDETMVSCGCVMGEDEMYTQTTSLQFTEYGYNTEHPFVPSHCMCTQVMKLDQARARRSGARHDGLVHQTQ